MHFFILSILIGPEFSLFMLSLWLLDSLFLFGFMIVVCRVFSSARREKYREESFIPLEDDSPEEKALFRNDREISRERLGRFEA